MKWKELSTNAKLHACIYISILALLIVLICLLFINSAQCNAQENTSQVETFKQQGDVLQIETVDKLDMKCEYSIHIQTTDGAMCLANAVPSAPHRFRINTRELGINNTICLCFIVSKTCP